MISILIASIWTASWYGPGFHGNLTANGERYNQWASTAAHKTLPFGTKVRVCNGNRCETIRINDRGPYIRGRDIDLSRGTAERIGLVNQGVGKLTYTILKK